MGEGNGPIDAFVRTYGSRGPNEWDIRSDVWETDPNLVRVHGIVEIEGQPVLLMDRITGPSLAALLAREAPLPERRVIHC